MKRTARSTRILSLVLFGVVLNTVAGMAYVINNFWPDGDNIVMDNVLSPASPWGDNAEFQMSEWNEVDVTDNSHPFRVSLSPEFSFGANDGDNTIGFLGEAALNSEYGLSFSSALAWAVCWAGGSGGRYDECDVIIDVNRPWVIGPDDAEWFQSTVLHELGHVRGLGHYNGFLSMQNSGTSKYLRNEVLYMDDKVGVRQNASNVSERDIVMYNKWHNGSTPQWMSMSPLSLREGQTINLNNITVENRGTLSFGSLRFGVYLSTNSTISTGDTLLNTGSWGSFGTFTFSTFNWSATIPTINDCGTRYIGGIIDDNGAYSERFEGNNAVLFTNGVPFSGSSFVPTPLTIRLREDTLEPNDSRPTAAFISLPFFNSGLSIDADFENDYYRFTASGPGQVNVSATFTHALGNIDMQLLNSVGTVLATSASTTNNESINFNIGSAGTYYIRVYGNGSGSCNKYTLNATLAQIDLQVTVLNAPVEAVPGQAISVANTVRNA
ncbi:MAG: pre-peptidase C-terminal domain-containing protein, partial [Vicinamibacteria bacterium]